MHLLQTELPHGRHQSVCGEYHEYHALRSEIKEWARDTAEWSFRVYLPPRDAGQRKLRKKKRDAGELRSICKEV